MYIFDFDPETNGIELSWRDTEGKISRREAKIEAFRDDGCSLFE